LADTTQNAGVVLQTSVGLAGLLLVFIGFVFSRAESTGSSRRADKYKNTARAGFIPFVLSLFCAWLCMNSMGGTVGAYDWAVVIFRFAIITT
jgi:hypothetical protein